MSVLRDIIDDHLIEKLSENIALIDSKKSEELLIVVATGELWLVDSSALREYGIPTDKRWRLYSDVSKVELLAALRCARTAGRLDYNRLETCHMFCVG